ncbi:hypothetical protein ATANTOWER_015166 [Ataeniobius toweri]|uniref:Uncharacterized protein n=1 Tax=Ataeniobius toweri TaxID=208326 RepID=A0ABU7A6G9_9TELE|nr:hypothetical protein [Ataeniobius toweri]
MHLYSNLSNPQRPQSALNYNQSFNHSYTHSHTDSGKLNCSHSHGRLIEVRLPYTGATEPCDHHQQARRVKCLAQGDRQSKGLNWQPTGYRTNLYHCPHRHPINNVLNITECINIIILSIGLHCHKMLSKGK